MIWRENQSRDAFDDMERELQFWREEAAVYTGATRDIARFSRNGEDAALTKARDVGTSDEAMLHHLRGEAFAYRQVNRKLREFAETRGLSLT